MIPIQYSGERGNALIYNSLKEAFNRNYPLLVSKFGSIEANTVGYFLINQTFGRKAKRDYPLEIKERNHFNTGVNPPTSEMLDNFSQIYLQAAHLIDILAIWGHFGEEEIVQKTNPRVTTIDLGALEPYYWPSPRWTDLLEGKRVLIIHPFVKSLEKQYPNRDLIWNKDNILPTFTPIFYSPPQSQGDIKANWKINLFKMCHDVSSLSFDIALVGCGGYGLPISSFIKNNLKRPVIHLGGCLQILFGIKGKRWDEIPAVNKFYNKHWKYPYKEETPSCADHIEGQCYWEPKQKALVDKPKKSSKKKK